MQLRSEAKLSTTILTEWKKRFIDAYDLELQAFINNVISGEMTGPLCRYRRRRYLRCGANVRRDRADYTASQTSVLSLTGKMHGRFHRARPYPTPLFSDAPRYG